MRTISRDKKRKISQADQDMYYKGIGLAMYVKPVVEDLKISPSNLLKHKKIIRITSCSTK